jgi:hypothetical protein
LPFWFAFLNNLLFEPAIGQLLEVANPENIVEQARSIHESDIHRHTLFFQPFRQEDGQFGYGQAMCDDMRWDAVLL